MALGWRGSYTRYREFFLDIAGIYKKKTEVKVFLEIILSIGAIIIFTIFALKPTALTIINLTQQIKEKEKTLESLTKKVSDLQTAKTILNQNQNIITDTQIAIASLPTPDIFLQQIEGLSAKNSTELLGVSINQVTIIGEVVSKPNKDYQMLPDGVLGIPFSISVKGGYLNIMALIKDLEKLKIISKLDSFAISSSTTDKGLSIIGAISGRIPIIDNK